MYVCNDGGNTEEVCDESFAMLDGGKHLCKLCNSDDGYLLLVMMFEMITSSSAFRTAHSSQIKQGQQEVTDGMALVVASTV